MYVTLDPQDVVPALTDVVPPLTDVMPSLLRQLVALTKERQQVVSRSEAELAPRIDFLNPPGDAMFRAVGV